MIRFSACGKKIDFPTYFDDNTSITGTLLNLNLLCSSYRSVTSVCLVSLATPVSSAGSVSWDSWYKMLKFNQNHLREIPERRHSFALSSNPIAAKCSKNLLTSSLIGRELDLLAWSDMIRDLIRSWSDLSGDLVEGDWIWVETWSKVIGFNKLIYLN